MKRLNEEKFTKGPWVVVYERAWGWCVKVGKKYLAFRIVNEFDAHLIAAAPEMYEFIAKQIGEMNCICRLNKTMALMNVQVECTVCAGNKLLASARGKL